jgi:integrase
VNQKLLSPQKGKCLVKIENVNGRIRLRWTYQTKRYCLAAKLSTSPTNLKSAQRTALQIELDIAAKNFDCTLKRYGKDSPLTTVASSLDLWERWVKSLKLSDRTANGHYKAIGNCIATYSPSTTSILWLEKVQWSASTFNSRLGYLRRCFDWGVEQQLVRSNPYQKVKRKQTTKGDRIQPFSKDEMHRILDALRTNTSAPKRSAYPHSHYSDFVEFLILSGCRPSEAIGLQRKHIDFNHNQLVICSSMSRGDNGSAQKRIRKDTKTHNVRILSLTDRLRSLLIKYEAIDGEALLFPTHLGNPINDCSFNRRLWKPLLSSLSIPYRRPYILRHTFASVALEQNVPITDVAYLLGHSDTSMVCKVYGHLIDRPQTPNVL